MDLDLSGSVHRLIAGPTGSGKSYFVGSLVEQLRREERPFIILDTKTKNHGGLISLPGVVRVVIRPGKSYNWDRLVKYPYVLVVPSPRMMIGDLISIYTDLLDRIYAAAEERVIIVEEAHNFNKNAYSPSPILELISREGRGRGICLWFLTQRIQDFPKLLWSQCYWSYLLKFLIPQDIRYAEALIPDFSQINRDLDRHDVLEYDHITGKHNIIKAHEVNRSSKHLG